MTLAKDRRGWFLIGIATGGIALPFAALLLTARPGSPWARTFYDQAKTAGAERHFRPHPDLAH